MNKFFYFIMDLRNEKKNIVELEKYYHVTWNAYCGCVKKEENKKNKK